MNLTKQEVLEKLCYLVSEVGAEVYSDMINHDCFCGKITAGFETQIDEQVIKFIEDAVHEKMNKK